MLLAVNHDAKKAHKQYNAPKLIPVRRSCLSQLRTAAEQMALLVGGTVFNSPAHVQSSSDDLFGGSRIVSRFRGVQAPVHVVCRLSFKHRVSYLTSAAGASQCTTPGSVAGLNDGKIDCLIIIEEPSLADQPKNSSKVVQVFVAL